jgi:hypothetical protein
LREEEEHIMANWLRLVLALVVGAHGLGHILFLVAWAGWRDWFSLPSVYFIYYMMPGFCQLLPTLSHD